MIITRTAVRIYFSVGAAPGLSDSGNREFGALSCRRAMINPLLLFQRGRMASPAFLRIP